jgi:sugar O-acyltransferase (sialic acid O-acetyltransferase NeuD family)
MKHNDFSKIAIFGTGGFAREVLCLIYDVKGISPEALTKEVVFVSNDAHDPKEIYGFKVIPESEFDPSQYQATIGIGDGNVRKKLSGVLKEKFPSIRFPVLVHPSVVVSPWVEIGEGGIICAGTILTCGIKIGKQVQFNLDCTVGHDCVIGDYVTTAPGVKISGNCELADFVYLGTNASLKQGVKISEKIVVGMAASVVGNLEVEGTYIGIPAKLLQRKS